jgi:hypothetical protein
MLSYMRVSTLPACLVLSLSLLDGNAQETLHPSSARISHAIATNSTVAAASSSISRGAATQPMPPLIVIGFMGGRVRADNTIHQEAELASKLQHDYAHQIHANVFANHDGKRAYLEILRTLDVNHDGLLSPAEKRNARIVIYGHSWGASETVNLARKLGRDGIAVLLTVQVDSIAKAGEEDAWIPANVSQAVNFYQRTGLLHGRTSIHAVDPQKTHIIGNFQFSYSDHHIPCSRYPWFARKFMGPHIEIENDPRVWDWIESTIEAELTDGPRAEASLVPAQ